MTENDIINEIVASDGHCFDTERCTECPFAQQCFVDMLLTHPKYSDVQKNRVRMALQHIITGIIENEQEN